MLRRFLVTLALLLGGSVCAHAQVLNPLTKVFVIPISGDCDTTPCSNASRSLCRESAASTATFVCDTGTGFYVPSVAASVCVAAGLNLNLEGCTGDTYLVKDLDTGCMQQWKDGTLGWQLCNGYVVPPDCGTDTSTVPFGGMCKDQATGRVRLRATAIEVF